MDEISREPPIRGKLIPKIGNELPQYTSRISVFTCIRIPQVFNLLAVILTDYFHQQWVYNCTS